MLSLLDQVAERPNRSKICSQSGCVPVTDLVQQAQAVRQCFPQLKNQKVLINQPDLAEFIVALLAFDGFCAALYLCPDNLDGPSSKDLIHWPLASQKLDPLPESQKQKATQWFIATSGTTGQAKWISHTLDSLTSNIKVTQSMQALSWGLMYQVQRFAGLQVLLQALLSAAELVNAAGLAPLEQVSLLQQYQVSAISATPSLWRQLLMTKQLVYLPLTHITLGGEIADQVILNQLSKLFPKAKIKHIYASTEAGVGFVVSDGKAGFPAKWLTDNAALTVQLKVSDEQHLLLKPPHNLCPSLTALIDSQGFVDSLDQVQIVQDRVLFLGRVSGAINVGGNKVYPEKVEQVLLQNQEIRQVRVYGKANAIMGALVVAEVVLSNKQQPETTLSQLNLLCKNHLERFERPSKIRIVDELANDKSGKLNRKTHD